ncbi:MAG: glycosyltransferase family 2 protein [Lachnospiraceae bacterium]|nr:glycosyltransferase family 2 protein [Lachnospiraceae bacterium]
MRHRPYYHKGMHTFVVCAYGESPYLEECVRSLLHQSELSTILIATSTPNACIAAVSEKYQLPVYVNEGEKSLANDWNFALQCAKTPLVTLAHQDDLYYENYTCDTLKTLNRCAHPLISFTDYYELRDGQTVPANRLLRVKRLMLSPLRWPMFWKNRFVRRRILSFGSAICCPSVTLVKENLIGFAFRNNMKSNIDWQAWEEISRKKGEFAYISHPCMGHRIHQSSTTSDLLEKNGRREEDLYVFRKFWPERVARLIEYFYQSSEKSNELK